MRIVVNDIAASKTGALSVLIDFYNYIRDNDTENEWIFLLSDHYLEETDRIKVVVLPDVKKGWIYRLKFDLLNGAETVKKLNPDVYFSMQNTLLKGYRGKQALYVHQPLGYQKEKNFSFLKSREREYAIYQHVIGKMINVSVRKADLVFVQTKWMKEAVVAKTHVNPNKVCCVLPTMQDLSAYRCSKEPLGNEFFYPSGDILYKNHKTIAMAISELLNRGIQDFKVHVTLNEEELIKNTGPISDEVLKAFDCMGRLEREKVYEMYGRCTLLFASYIETFGYPPAEGAAIGTNILASDCPFSREVLEGYQRAAFFAPFDSKALADLMQDSIEGKLFNKLPLNTSFDGINPVENSWGEVVAELTSL